MLFAWRVVASNFLSRVSCRTLCCKFQKQKRASMMTEVPTSQPHGLPLRELVKKLEAVAPLELAESWDNVGLLLSTDNEQVIKRILLCNDLTENVVKETLPDTLIFSYHPPIFTPLKKITTNSWKEKLILMCVERKVPIYSPHTSLDAVKGGVTDWLCEGLGKGTVVPIEPFSKSPPFGAYQLTFNSDTSKVNSANMKNVNEAWKRLQETFDLQHLSHHKHCVFQNDQLCSMEYLLSKSELLTAMDIIEKEMPNIPEVHWSIRTVDKQPVPGTGQGRIITLDEEISLATLITRVKSHLNLKYVRLATPLPPEKMIVKRIAVCPGAGWSVIQNVHNVDCYVTGEARHHEILDKVQCGKAVILSEHSHTERGYLSVLKEKLHTFFEGKVAVDLSSTDTDPIILV